MPRRLTARDRLNRANARRYPAGELAKTADDELLNVSAVCVEFPIGYWAFMQRQRRGRGWPGLKGKALAAYNRNWAKPGDKAAHRLEETYLRSEIAGGFTNEGWIKVGGKWRKQPTAVNGRYTLPDGTIRLNFERSRRELGNGRTPMARGTLNAHAAAGRITFDWWKSPDTAYQEQTCSEKKLLELKALLNADKPTERTGADRLQILVTKAGETLARRWQKRYGRRRRWRNSRLSEWADHGCPLLGGDKITLYRSPGRPSWLLKEDFARLDHALRLPRGHYLLKDPATGRDVVCVGVSYSRGKGMTQAQFYELLAGQPKQFMLTGKGSTGERRRVIPKDIVDRVFGQPTASNGTGDNSAPQLASNGSAPNTPSRRGPRRSAVTQEVYTACYDLLAEGNSRRAVMRLLSQRFNDPKYLASLPKEESHVGTYASRAANDPQNPRPWPIPGRRK